MPWSDQDIFSGKKVLLKPNIFRFFLFPVIDDTNKSHSLTLNQPLVIKTVDFEKISKILEKV